MVRRERERWRGGSVKKARMKEEGEAGAETWIKASPRERAGVGGGDLFGQGIDLQAPGSDAGRRSVYAVF